PGVVGATGGGGGGGPAEECGAAHFKAGVAPGLWQQLRGEVGWASRRSVWQHTSKGGWPVGCGSNSGVGLGGPRGGVCGSTLQSGGGPWVVAATQGWGWGGLAEECVAAPLKAGGATRAGAVGLARGCGGGGRREECGAHTSKRGWPLGCGSNSGVGLGGPRGGVGVSTLQSGG